MKQIDIGGLFGKSFVLEQEGVWTRDEMDKIMFIRIKANTSLHDNDSPAISANDMTRALDYLADIACKLTRDFPMENTTFRQAAAFRGGIFGLQGAGKSGGALKNLQAAISNKKAPPSNRPVMVNEITAMRLTNCFDFIWFDSLFLYPTEGWWE